MTTNEIVGRLKAGGLDASSTNRSAAVYVTEARSGRDEPGWFGFRIICDSEATERRVRAILSRWYDIDASGNVWRLRAKNRVPLMAIKRGGVPPTPPTPTGDYMYFEAAEANSTVSMMSMLQTAPDLEYSTDGETWQEWQHTTADGTHTFDTLTLTAIGDRVYLRGNNHTGLSTEEGQSAFILSGQIRAGGKIVSLLDKTMQMTVLPAWAFASLMPDFSEGESPALLSAPSFEGITEIGEMACASMFYNQNLLANTADMSDVSVIQGMGCAFMYASCTSLPAGANMPSLVAVGYEAVTDIYADCTFAMSDDGTTLNFVFPNPPITTTGDDPQTYATAYDVAEWMGNTNGFTTP